MARELSKRLDKLEARMHPVSRGLELFVGNLAALRSKDPARIAAMRATLASEPDDGPGEGGFVAPALSWRYPMSLKTRLGKLERAHEWCFCFG